MRDYSYKEKNKILSKEKNIMKEKSIYRRKDIMKRIGKRRLPTPASTL